MLNKESQVAYINAILSLNSIPANKYASVVSEILEKSYFDDEYMCMSAMLNTSMKKRISSKLGLKSTGPVGGAISAMIDANMARMVDSGLYIFNPVFFGSEHWSNIGEIRISNVFGEDGVHSYIEASYNGDYRRLCSNKLFDDADNVNPEGNDNTAEEETD